MMFLTVVGAFYQQIILRHPLMQHDIYQTGGIESENEASPAQERDEAPTGFGTMGVYWMWASVVVTLMGVAVMFVGIFQNWESQGRVQQQIDSVTGQITLLNQAVKNQESALGKISDARDELIQAQSSSMDLMRKQVEMTKQQLAEQVDEVRRTQQQLAEQEEKILRAQAQIVNAQMTLYGNQSNLALSESLLVRKINSLNAQTQDAVTAMQTQNQAQAQEQAASGDTIPVAPPVKVTDDENNHASSRDFNRALPVSNPNDPPQGALVRGPRIPPAGDETNSLPQDSQTGTARP